MIPTSIINFNDFQRERFKACEISETRNLEKISVKNGRFDLRGKTKGSASREKRVWRRQGRKRFGGHNVCN